MTQPKSPLRPFSVILAVALYVACGETQTGKPESSPVASAGAPDSTSTLRPATAAQRKGLDEALLSLSVLLDRARADLANDYSSESHQRLVGDAERDLVQDSTWLGAGPSGTDSDVNYQEAYRLTNEVMNTVRLLMTFRPGDPQASREALVQRAEEALRRAREARGRMARG
jgi:hypothetical protein